MRKLLAVSSATIACLTLQAQGNTSLRNRLAQPDPTHKSRVVVTEHGDAATAVAATQTTSEGRIRGYRVRIFSDNGQNARAAAQQAIARFTELFPGIPYTLDYDTPYWKVTVGYCYTAEEATILWGKVKDAFNRAVPTREDIPISRFGETRNASTGDSKQE